MQGFQLLFRELVRYSYLPGYYMYTYPSFAGSSFPLGNVDW